MAHLAVNKLDNFALKLTLPISYLVIKVWCVTKVFNFQLAYFVLNCNTMKFTISYQY